MTQELYRNVLALKLSQFYLNLVVHVYIFCIKFQLCEPEVAGSGKYQCNAFLHVLLHGCRSDLTSHDTNWTNVQMGISQATIQPAGDCCCGTSEANETQVLTIDLGLVGSYPYCVTYNTDTYIMSQKVQIFHKTEIYFYFITRCTYYRERYVKSQEIIVYLLQIYPFLGPQSP